MIKWSLFLASFVLLSLQQEVVGILCAQCSYFPDYFDYLKDEAFIKAINVLHPKSNLSEKDKKTVLSFKEAINLDTHECYEHPYKFVSECPGAEYNTCIRQSVSKKNSEQDPTIVLSCATWGKENCHNEEDESNIMDICGCITDLCNIQPNKRVTKKFAIKTTEKPANSTTEDPRPSKKDPVGLVIALIGLIIAGIKLSCVCFL